MGIKKVSDSVGAYAGITGAILGSGALIIATLENIRYTAASLGGEFEYLSTGEMATAFDMAASTAQIATSAPYLAASAVIAGTILATSSHDIKDLGAKIKNLGSGLLNISSKTSQEIGLEKDQPSFLLRAYTKPTSPFLNRAVCRIVEMAGAYGVLTGIEALAASASSNLSFADNPGMSTLALGAAATLGVGGALVAAGHYALKKSDDHYRKVKREEDEGPQVS
jgi:hypothetical protein